MAYESVTSLILGTSQVGLNLVAQIIDSKGVSFGSPIETGFVEIGNGNYIWTYSNFQDDFRGAVKFYAKESPLNIITVVPINSEEIQYVKDIKIKLNECCNSPEINPNIQTPRFGAAGSKSNSSNIKIG